MALLRRDFDTYIYSIWFYNYFYATNVLFSPLYATPFLYVLIHLGVLHKHGACIYLYIMWFKTAMHMHMFR